MMAAYHRTRRSIPAVLCALGACVVVPAGCSKPQPPAAALPGSAAVGPSHSGGRVAGKVAMAAAGIPVIILLDPKAEQELPAQSERPVMDQAALTFGPPLL